MKLPTVALCWPSRSSGSRSAQPSSGSDPMTAFSTFTLEALVQVISGGRGLGDPSRRSASTIVGA